MKCGLHVCCITDVYAQYGSWFSLQITVWSSFFPPSPSLLSRPSSSILPQLLNPIPASSLGGNPLTLLPLHSSGRVAFVCVCEPRLTRLPWTGLRIAFEGSWHCSGDGSRFLCLSYTIQCCSWGCFVCCYPCELCQLHLELVPGPSACNRLSWP